MGMAELPPLPIALFVLCSISFTWHAEDNQRQLQYDKLMSTADLHNKATHR
jgi:hypothetical protein